MTRPLPLLLLAALAGCGPSAEEGTPARLSLALAEALPAGLTTLEVGVLGGGDDCGPFITTQGSLTCPSPVENPSALLGLKAQADGETQSRLTFPVDTLDASGRATLSFHVPVGDRLRILVQALGEERQLLGSTCIKVPRVSVSGTQAGAHELSLLAPEADCQPILP